MEKISAKNFGKIISHTYDDGAIYIVHNHNYYFLSIIDPISFEVIENLTFESQPSEFSPLVDDNNLYIPMIDNQISIIDKFSGDNIGHIDLGNSVLASQLYQYGSYIYCLCGTPIANGIKSDTQNYSIMAINKDSFKREFQSRLIKCQYPIFSLLGNKSCIISENQVLIFSEDLSSNSEFSINFKTNFSLLESESYYICASPKGSLEAVSKDNIESQSIKMVTANHSSCSPLLLQDDELIWFMDSGVFNIDLKKRLTTHIGDIPYKILHTGSQFENVIYCSDEKGILQYNMNVPNDHMILQGANKVFSSSEEFFVTTASILYKLKVYHD